MSTTAENVQDNPQLDAWLNKRLDELLPKKLEEIESSKTPSMSIIATKGTLDWAYPPSFWRQRPLRWVGRSIYSLPSMDCCC